MPPLDLVKKRKLEVAAAASKGGGKKHASDFLARQQFSPHFHHPPSTATQPHTLSPIPLPKSTPSPSAKPPAPPPQQAKENEHHSSDSCSGDDGEEDTESEDDEALEIDQGKLGSAPSLSIMELLKRRKLRVKKLLSIYKVRGAVSPYSATSLQPDE
eukprot:scaffold109_cov389-Prasinococcus_capsulatus_cf.AAC.2